MKKKRMRSLKELLLPRILLGNYLVIIIALLVTSIGVYSFLKNEIGRTQVKVLQQISDLNQLNMNAVKNTMTDLYSSIQSFINLNSIEKFDEAQAALVMKETQRCFSNMGVDSMVDIILKDVGTYTSDGDMSRVDALKKTVRYTHLISGSRTESWYMNFSNREDSEKGILLSFGRTLFDEDGDAAGIVIISTSQKTLLRSYKNTLNENNVIYILDESGIVISHSNPRLIGFSFYYMPTFEKKVGPYNSYTVKTKNNRPVLLSNYHNEESGWTFVEELDLTSKLKDYSWTIVIVIAGVMLCSIFMVGLDFVMINKVTNSLTRFSRHIKSLQPDINNDITEIPVQEDYAEINIITERFNKMLVRIQELIQNIKTNERKKRKVEFDFLQAQIEPHFLRNTLLTLKSLIALGESRKAMSMLDDFNALLKIPMMVEKQFVPVYEEVELVMHYMAIMEYRFDKRFLLQIHMPEEIKHVLVPRMILQPVAANALFHGFAEKEDNAIITITAYEQEEDLYIVINDNGEGMTEEQIQMVLAGKRNVNSHHGVGLQNVKSRLQLIYGDRARLEIKSTVNVGTEVTLVFAGYRSVYFNDEENQT